MQPNTGPRRRPASSHRRSGGTRTPGDVDVVGARIGAQVVDLILTFVLTVLAMVLVGSSLQSAGAMFLAGLVVMLGYGTVLEGGWGKTAGKALVGIRVVDRSGSDVGYGAAFIRNVPALFGGWLTWIVGIAAIAVDDRNQRMFDQAADTYVVRG